MCTLAKGKALGENETVGSGQENEPPSKQNTSTKSHTSLSHSVTVPHSYDRLLHFLPQGIKQDSLQSTTEGAGRVAGQSPRRFQAQSLRQSSEVGN